MPLKSYLAHPEEGKKEDLVLELSLIKGCEVVAAKNKELIILVTETEDKDAEEILKNQLERVENLKLLSMVSGFDA